MKEEGGTYFMLHPSSLRGNNVPPHPSKYRIGDVFQINERHGRKGWMGAFVLCTEIKTWGIQGFVHMIKTSEEPPGFAYIRLKWEEIDYIGHAGLVPQEVAEDLEG